MSKIELEPREIFGYGLALLGIVLLIYAYLQAAITINSLMSFVGKLMPTPTISTYTQLAQAQEMPGFAESLTWFFMLIIQTLVGIGIASLGVSIAKKS